MEFVNHVIPLVVHVHLETLMHVSLVRAAKFYTTENVLQPAQMEHIPIMDNVMIVIHYVKHVMDILIPIVNHVPHHISIIQVNVSQLAHLEHIPIHLLILVPVVITTVIHVLDQMLVIVILVKMDYIFTKDNAQLLVMMDTIKMVMIIHVTLVMAHAKHVVVEHQPNVSHVSFHMNTIYMEHNV